MNDDLTPRVRAHFKYLGTLLEDARREQDGLRACLEAVRDAHEWGCDCTPDDPCRILIALNGGPSRPGASRCTCGEVWSGHPNPHALTCQLGRES